MLYTKITCCIFLFSSVPRNRNPYQEAIVFVIGGGNYIEYTNLVDYAKVSGLYHYLYAQYNSTL